jgi:O-antigen/teichoic acid export membrane protein
MHRAPESSLAGPASRSPLQSLRILLPGSAANLAVQGLLLMCGLGTGTATARVLGPVHRGELSFLVLVPSALTVLGSLGVEFGTYYLWHQEGGRLRSQILAAGLLVTALSGVVAAAIGFTVVAWFEPQAGLFPALLVAAGVPLSIANAILTMALMANRRMFAYNVSRLVGPVGYTLAIAAFWELRSLGLMQALSAWFGSVILTVVADVVLVAWMGASMPRWDRRIARRTVGYGLRSYVGTVAQYGTLQLDQGLLVALAGNGALGLYYAAVSVGQVVLYLANNISSAMMGQFSNRPREQQWHLAAVAVVVTAAATAGIVSILFFFAGSVILVVLGAAYLPGLTAVRILLPGLVFLAATRVMSGYFIAVGRAPVFARAAVAGLVVTVAGDLTLIPKFQADGAALASTIAYGVMMIWLWRIFRTERGVKKHAKSRSSRRMGPRWPQRSHAA